MELYVIIDDLARAVGRAAVRQLKGHRGVSALASLPGRCRPLPPPFVVLEEFLVCQELAALLDFTLTHERAFVETQVMQVGHQTGRLNHDERRSRVVYAFEPCQSILVDRVLAVLPRVLDTLGDHRFKSPAWRRSSPRATMGSSSGRTTTTRTRPWSGAR
jgi:hypothetical protein